MDHRDRTDDPGAPKKYQSHYREDPSDPHRIPDVLYAQVTHQDPAEYKET
jgi:hypothetical protein